MNGFYDGTPLWDVFMEAATGSLTSVWSIAIIVFPLMIALEVARDLDILKYFSRACKPITRLLGITDHSALPLAVGLVFGLSYGAGVIIQEAESGLLDKKSLILLSIFLATCHAVIEDTLLFVAVGANGWFLLTVRLIVAFILTVVLSKVVRWSNVNGPKDQQARQEA